MITSQNIIVGLVDLLQNPLIGPYLQTDTTPPVDEHGRKIYNSNVYSGSVCQWLAEDVKLTSGNPDAIVVPLAVFSDGCSMSKTRNMHSVKFGILSVPERIRNVWMSKYNLTFLPFPTGNPRTRSSAPFKRGKGLLFTQSFNFILKPLVDLQDTGFIFLTSTGHRLHLVPRLALMPVDTPELSSLNRCFCAWNCKRPCPVCEVRRGRDMWVVNPTLQSESQWRTVDRMKLAITSGNAHEMSIHPQPVSSVSNDIFVFLNNHVCIYCL